MRSRFLGLRLGEHPSHAYFFFPFLIIFITKLLIVFLCIFLEMRAPRVGKKERKGEEREGSEEEKEAKKEKEKSSAARGKKG